MTAVSPDIREILKRGEEAAHCARLRRWLRASIVINVLLIAAVAGIVAGYSSSYSTNGAAAPSTAPSFSGGAK